MYNEIDDIDNTEREKRVFESEASHATTVVLVQREMLPGTAFTIIIYPFSYSSFLCLPAPLGVRVKMLCYVICDKGRVESVGEHVPLRRLVLLL